MARPLRIEYPGAYYHVLNRGNAGVDIFTTDRDHEKFLEYVGLAAERFSIVIHTYCLMSNHFHLLVETPEPNLSRAIQWLNVSYATYFNLKHKRRGHLFQGRFKAFLVDADAYLLQLSRYIHLNPMRAGMAAKPALYPWSSYPFLIGSRKSPPWLSASLLADFGSRKQDAIRKYRAFVEEVDPFSIENPAKDVTGGFILGEAGFVSWVQENFIDDAASDTEIPQLKILKPRITVDEIVLAVADVTDCRQEEILAKGSKGSEARAMAMYLAREFSGLSGKELGMRFGGVSGAAITMRCNGLREKLITDTNLQRLVAKAKKRIFNF